MKSLPMLKSNELYKFRTFKVLQSTTDINTVHLEDGTIGTSGIDTRQIVVGTITACYIHNKQNNELYIGLAFCGPTEQYNKAKGRLIAHSKLQKHRVITRIGDESIKEALSRIIRSHQDIRWFNNVYNRELV